MIIIMIHIFSCYRLVGEGAIFFPTAFSPDRTGRAGRPETPPSLPALRRCPLGDNPLPKPSQHPGAEWAQSPAQEEGEERPGAPLQCAPLHLRKIPPPQSPPSQPGAAARTVCVAPGQGKRFILVTAWQLRIGLHPEGKAPLPTGSHTQSLASSKEEPPEMNKALNIINRWNTQNVCGV